MKAYFAEPEAAIRAKIAEFQWHIKILEDEIIQVEGLL